MLKKKVIRTLRQFRSLLRWLYQIWFVVDWEERCTYCGKTCFYSFLSADEVWELASLWNKYHHLCLECYYMLCKDRGIKPDIKRILLYMKGEEKWITLQQ